MRIHSLARAAALATIASSGLAAQALPAGASIRVAPQFTSYTVGAPGNKTISQFALPIAVEVPLFSRLSIEVGTAYAKSKLTQSSTTSEITGFTDTQVRGNLTFGNDNLVLTAGMNVPTGQSTVKLNQVLAAGQIGSEFLAFPIPSMGSGMAATGGLAVAKNFGAWNLGAGGAFRHATEFEPFQSPDTSANVKYQPGNEIRARVGLDRTVGDQGSLSLGFTVSQFQDDKAANFAFNSGNRYITQVSYATRAAGAEVFLSAWDNAIGAGRGVSGPTPTQNIINGAAAMGWSVGAITIEPNVEGRFWTLGGSKNGVLGGAGLRSRIPAGALVIYPGVGFNVGKLGSGATESSLSGFRGTLTAHLR